MTQMFDDIKDEIVDFRDELDKKRASEAELLEQRIESDRVLLENSGVKQIFEEIRDSGLVKLRPKRMRRPGLFSRKKNDNESGMGYIPAEIIDNHIYISLRFDERSDGCNEVRIAAIGGRLCIAHGYNRVDYTPIDDGGMAEAIIEGIKNPLRVKAKL